VVLASEELPILAQMHGVGKVSGMNAGLVVEFGLRYD
jgi:hypothetical protein